MKKTEDIREEFEKTGSWGMLTSIDLHECSLETMTDKEKIKAYVKELCRRIGMKTFGETLVIKFGEDPKVAGFSMTQLIETSLISGHLQTIAEIFI